MMPDEPRSQLDIVAHVVIGAAIEVHRHLGPGYLESVYEEALALEMQMRGIQFSRQHPVGLDYKGRRVGEARLDFWIEEQLVLELKAVDLLTPLFTAQVISYLKAMDCTLGLLINFNVPKLRDGIRRIVLS